MKRILGALFLIIIGFVVFSDFDKTNADSKLVVPKNDSIEKKFKKNKDKKLKTIDEFVASKKEWKNEFKNTNIKMKKRILKKNLEQTLPVWNEALQEVDDERQLNVVTFTAKDYEHYKLGYLENAKISAIYDAETEEYIGGVVEKIEQ